MISELFRPSSCVDAVDVAVRESTRLVSEFRDAVVRRRPREEAWFDLDGPESGPADDGGHVHGRDAVRGAAG